MRTNIDVDKELLEQAMRVTGATTKRAAVEAALRLTVQLKNQEKILDLFGKVQWDGDLDVMRQSRFSEWGEELVQRKEAPHEDGLGADIFRRHAGAGVDS